MANENEIRISSHISPVNINVVDAGDSGSVQSKSIDANVSRGFGGRYNTLTYSDDTIISYIGYILKSSSTALSGTFWAEAGTSNGTAPTTVKAFAMEYTAELGTVGFVYVKMALGAGSAVEMAKLDLGEGVVIPVSSGITPANIQVYADGYSNDVNEATVNIFIVGV